MHLADQRPQTSSGTRGKLHEELQLNSVPTGDEDLLVSWLYLVQADRSIGLPNNARFTLELFGLGPSYVPATVPSYHWDDRDDAMKSGSQRRCHRVVIYSYVY
jgi:hypothetical protein